MKRPFAPGTVEQLRYSLNEIRKVGMEYVSAGKVLAIQISDPTRSLPQNAKLHSMIGEIVKAKIKWYGQEMSMEDWKAVFTAAIHREFRVVPGLDGGMVVLGLHTSQMSVKEITDMIEMVYAFGADPAHPVDFKENAPVEAVGRMCA
jgi:hypothetical protein